MDIRLGSSSSSLAEKRAFPHTITPLESLSASVPCVDRQKSKDSLSSLSLTGGNCFCSPSSSKVEKFAASIFQSAVLQTKNFCKTLDGSSNESVYSFVNNEENQKESRFPGMNKSKNELIVKIVNNNQATILAQELSKISSAVIERARPLDQPHNIFISFPMAFVTQTPPLLRKYARSATQLFTSSSSARKHKTKTQHKDDATTDKEEQAKQRNHDLLKNFAAGAVAGVISRTSTAPFERLKILYQVNYDGTHVTPNMLTGLRQIYAQDGVTGFFRGNFTNVLRATPFSAIRFSVFDQMKRVLSQGKQIGECLRQGELFVAGAVAGLAANLAIYPMEVIRIRLTASPAGTYNGILDAFCKIQKSEGKILPFYKGATACLCSSMPNTGINLMTYETLKKVVIGQNPESEPHLAMTMAIGSTSALIASTLLYPMTAMSSRLIMKKSGKTSVRVLVGEIYSKEGLKGFFKGYTPGIVKIVFGNGVSFVAYEWTKKRLNCK